MNQEIGKKLLSILKVEQVKKDEPMKIHTTFRVGGPAMEVIFWYPTRDMKE